MALASKFPIFLTFAIFFSLSLVFKNIERLPKWYYTQENTKLIYLVDFQDGEAKNKEMKKCPGFKNCEFIAENSKIEDLEKIDAVVVQSDFYHTNQVSYFVNTT